MPAVREAAATTNPIDAFVRARLRAGGARAGASRVGGDDRPPPGAEPHGPAADAGGDRRVRRRPLGAGGAARRGPLPGLARLRRAHGDRLGGPGALRGHLRLPERRRTRHVALPRLGDPRLQRNLPYDQFLTWQLAGDLLPNATRDQRVATAFNRMHRQTNEGGSIEEEFRTEYVADRVNTFGTAMLGLTLECARCHDHKFDPITQRDYFSLFAFFNNIDESGLYSHYTNATPSPSLLLWPAEKESAAQPAEGPHRRGGAAALDAIAKAAEPAFQAWLKDARIAAPTPIAVLASEAIDVQRRRRGRASGHAAVHPHGRLLLRPAPAAHRTAGPRGRPAPVPLVVGRGQPRLRADARPRPAVLRPHPLLARQRHRGAREAAAADGRVVQPGGDLRRLQPRGGHPSVSERRAARRRGRARPPLQGHHLPQGGGRRCEGPADADAGRAVQGQRLQERADRGPAGVRHGADGGGGRRDDRERHGAPRARLLPRQAPSAVSSPPSPNSRSCASPRTP